MIGNGVFDQVTSPKLTGPFPATALQIGAPGATVAIAGGVHNTGAIESQAYQAEFHRHPHPDRRDHHRSSMTV